MDRILEDGIIELVEESEWIVLMVVQDKNIGKIMICLDLRNFNDECVYVSFPTQFTNQVLENIEGQEAYSFTYGFLGYH